MNTTGLPWQLIALFDAAGGGGEEEGLHRIWIRNRIYG